MGAVKVSEAGTGEDGLGPPPRTADEAFDRLANRTSNPRLAKQAMALAFSERRVIGAREGAVCCGCHRIIFLHPL